MKRFFLLLLLLPVICGTTYAYFHLKYPSVQQNLLVLVLFFIWIIISLSLIIIAIWFKKDNEGKKRIVSYLLITLFCLINIAPLTLYSIAGNVDFLFPFVSETIDFDNYLETDIIRLNEVSVEVSQFFPQKSEINTEKPTNYYYHYNRGNDNLRIELTCFLSNDVKLNLKDYEVKMDDTSIVYFYDHGMGTKQITYYYDGQVKFIYEFID